MPAKTSLTKGQEQQVTTCDQQKGTKHRYPATIRQPRDTGRRSKSLYGPRETAQSEVPEMLDECHNQDSIAHHGKQGYIELQDRDSTEERRGIVTTNKRYRDSPRGVNLASIPSPSSRAQSALARYKGCDAMSAESARNGFQAISHVICQCDLRPRAPTRSLQRDAVRAAKEKSWLF